LTVVDSAGYGLQGLSVTFTAPAFGASGTFSNGTNTITLTTGANGVASAVFKSNATLGSYGVTAASSGLNSVSFPMSNHGPLTKLTANASSSNQWAEISTPFLTPLVVTATDAAGNVVSGVSVTFTAPTSGPSGTFSNNATKITLVTDGAGVVAPSFTANAIPSPKPGSSGGEYFVGASAAGASGTGFALNNVGKPASIVLSYGGGAVTQINQAVRLAVQVVDSEPFGVPGATVTFTAPTSGPTGLFSNGTNTLTMTCDHGGSCQTILTANGTIGSWNITVSSPGVSSISYPVKNVGHPASMATNAGTTPQSTKVSTSFPVGFGVTIKDAYGNPVPGVGVTFTAPAFGPSGTFSNGTNRIGPDPGTTNFNLITDGNGVVSGIPFTANATTGGPYIVTATSGGLTVNFSLTNHP
jgi:hypothetical protein